ncbi:MAG: hypothetical protein JO142_10160 [Burkholderiales bacterium]|nr:hypothetical protein [Burkholderiales bacterium]
MNTPSFARPRPYSLVTIKDQLQEAARTHELPFLHDLPLIFLGEIPNMPEHGVFAGHRSGRLYSGYHIEQFIELSEDET